VKTIRFIDSHTGGEPTRAFPDAIAELGTGSLASRREILQARFGELGAPLVNEPRGSDILVGALLCEPADPAGPPGVIFFNNVGTLGMCGHGAIGLAVTLMHLGRIGLGAHRLDTPVGPVGFEMLTANRVRIENVPAYRYRKAVEVDVPHVGRIVGDIAWGGNWFFLVSSHGQRLHASRARELIDFTTSIRHALASAGATGPAGEEIDHIELFGPPSDPRNDSRNFVLCPGFAYDRSPCGTGTSAKLACLTADGRLKPGDIWRQESIVGSVFEGSIRLDGGSLIPIVAGEAEIIAEGVLRFAR